MGTFSAIEIRSYHDLLEAFAARKNEIGLSHEQVEAICGLTRGHWDKVFGPSAEKRMGWRMFDFIPPALGVKLLLVVDEPQAKLMHARWERRNTKQIRVRSHEVNRALLEHAKLEIFPEMARRRAVMLAASRRSEIASKAARTRWRKQRRVKNGSVS